MKIATLLVCGCKVYVTWYVYICEYIIVLEKNKKKKTKTFSVFFSLSLLVHYHYYYHSNSKHYGHIQFVNTSNILLLNSLKDSFMASQKNDRRRRRRTALMWCVLILKKEFHFVLFLLSFKGVKSKSCRNSTLSHHPKNFYF